MCHKNRYSNVLAFTFLMTNIGASVLGLIIEEIGRIFYRIRSSQLFLKLAVLFPNKGILFPNKLASLTPLIITLLLANKRIKSR